MNRKNLIELMVAIVAAALWGQTSAAPPPQTEDGAPENAKALDAARNAWSECVRAAIPALDHPEATSAAVARAAMDSCSDRYTDMVRVLSRTLVSTCGHDSACTRAALAKADREATRAATDDVVTSRVQVAGAQVLKCE